jgi:hypothetical protein
MTWRAYRVCYVYLLCSQNLLEGNNDVPVLVLLLLIVFLFISNDLPVFTKPGHLLTSLDSPNMSLKILARDGVSGKGLQTFL